MIETNFEILDARVPEKSLTQTSLCITLEWELEKGKRNFNIVVFFLHKTLQHSVWVYKIWKRWLS